MSDCGAGGEAEQPTGLLQHHHRCGSTRLHSGCSDGKTAQGKGRVSCCSWVCGLHISHCASRTILSVRQAAGRLIYRRGSSTRVPLQDEILCDTRALQDELECLMKRYEKAAQQRILVQQEHRHVAEVMVKVRTLYKGSPHYPCTKQL